MYGKTLLLVSNPFIDAYIQTDFLGKLIFISLILTSVCSWILFGYKFWLTREARKVSNAFYHDFRLQKGNPLHVESSIIRQRKVTNPFLNLYFVLKRYTTEILSKNRKFGGKEKKSVYLTADDVDSIASHLPTTIISQTSKLEKNLFILSTIVGLAPLLGLLGTVWGILTTFSELHGHQIGGTNQMMLSGLSLALTTTVLGLLSAIPALIAYNYLKNQIQLFAIDMETFGNEVLGAIEMQYRRVEDA